jgi:hypothetical protein
MRCWSWLLAALLFPVTASALDGAGSWVSVTVDVDGWPSPLYPAPDGSGRYYLQAREGAAYSVRLTNRTHERLGVGLLVDGLNVVSGDRATTSSPGRLYVLAPWDSTTVRGWRTSLEDVRRFTFVDERSSYSARSSRANGKMGWIEVAVYRERRPYVWRLWDEHERSRPVPREYAPGDDERAKDRDAPGTAEAQPAPEAKSENGGSGRADGLGRRDGYGAPATPYPAEPSYPGTGWGRHMDDPVTIVRFDPDPRPVECVTLRYEYAGALRVLGILPRPWPPRDRLSDRENGFAQPPAW